MFQRVWGMPTSDTLSCLPIADWVQKYTAQAKCVVDVFARDSMVGHWRNDLNPATKAEYHMDALDFLKMLIEKSVQPDLVIFDPPYSPTQMQRSYQDIGKTLESCELWRTGRWSQERALIDSLCGQGTHVLSFGWNSTGMGKLRGWKIVDGLLVNHGSGHNDTICVAERKDEERLFQ